MKKIESFIGGLFLTALLLAVFYHQLPLPDWLRATVLCVAAFTMGCLGIALFPRTSGSRPIIKRHLLIGASFALIGGGLLLVASLFDCHAFLAFMTGHSGAGGVITASAVVALTQTEVNEFKDILEKLKSNYSDIRKLIAILPDLERVPELRKSLNDLKRAGLGAMLGKNGEVRWIGNKPFVSDECATAITSVFVLGAGRLENGLER